MGRATGVRQRGVFILGVVTLKPRKLSRNKLKMFRIFLTEAVYMVLGFFYLFASNQDPSVREKYNFLLVNWIQRTFGGRMIRLLPSWCYIFLPPCKQPSMQRSHGNLRIFNLTGHFVHTEPFKIFALFTRNFERLGV